MVAVGLLDSTVRVYYDDSLRFALSLYGHKLPVMSLDISYDCTLLISGSADKTVKIWGLDFGDCHRSLLAHEDSVTSVRFQPGTHYFFSAGKDGNIKYWDADRCVSARVRCICCCFLRRAPTATLHHVPLSMAQWCGRSGCPAQRRTSSGISSCLVRLY